MSQGNDFNYSSATDAGTAGSEEIWFVAVASDDIKQMNVDQLDEAFRLGIVTEDTAVWTEGMEAWQPLGQVLGNDSEDGASARDEEARAGAGQVASAQVASAQAASAQVSASAPNGGFGAVTLQSAQHSYAPGPHGSMAPVTSSLAPSAHTARDLDRYAGVGTSLGAGGPASLSMDDDVPAVRPARRFRPERWALAAAALVGVGVAAYNNLSSSVASAGTAAAPAPTTMSARPYDGVEKGSAELEEKGTEEATPAAAKAEAEAEAAPVVGSIAKGAAAAGAAAAGAGAAAADDAEPPAASKKAADKGSLKGSFSKAFNGKKSTTARAAKVKPRKASTRATKARAKAKKPSVARSQSAFDPLNDSLP